MMVMKEAHDARLEAAWLRLMAEVNHGKSQQQGQPAREDAAESHDSNLDRKPSATDDCGDRDLAEGVTGNAGKIANRRCLPLQWLRHETCHRYGHRVYIEQPHGQPRRQWHQPRRTSR